MYKFNYLVIFFLLTFTLNICEAACRGGACVSKAGTDQSFQNGQGQNAQRPLSFSPLLNGLTFSGGSLTLPSVSGGSGAGAIDISAGPSSVCTKSGNTVTAISSGTCTLTVTKAASGPYSAQTVSQNIVASVNTPFALSDSTNTINLIMTSNLGQQGCMNGQYGLSWTPSNPYTVNISGGTPPYTTSFVNTGTQNPMNCTISDPNSSSPTMTCKSTLGSMGFAIRTAMGTGTLTIRDSASHTFTKTVNLYCGSH